MNGTYLDDVMENWKLAGSISSKMRIGLRYKHSEVVQLDDVT